MVLLEGTRAARFQLVSAAHHFILRALPFRHPQSLDALFTFIADADRCCLSSADREAVLLRVLAVLEPHTGGRLPSLIDRYFKSRHELPDPVERFHRCVADVIRYRGIGNVHVQAAVAMIHELYANPDLRQAAVAESLGLQAPALCAAFRAQTDLTFMEYLREVRLDRAAELLVRSLRSVKEVWVAVGYNDASNFNHDFKRRFGVPPSEYRAHAIHPASRPARADTTPPSMATAGPACGSRVLIVDDDRGTCDTIGAYLRLAGYVVGCAPTASEGLRHPMCGTSDVVVLDFHLPDMDGLTCLRYLRRQRPGSRPAVIVFTADWDVEDHVEQARALSAMVVSKLCDATELVGVIRSLCAWPQSQNV